MNPTASDVHVNKPLTNILIAYMQSAAGFVADTVFPNIPVQKQSDVYFKYDRSDWWRDQFRPRGPATESAGGGWKIGKDTYFCFVNALHKDVDDQIRANADEPIDMDRDATNWLAMQGLINREVHWATNFFKSGVWKGINGTVGDVTGVTSSPGANQVVMWDDVNSTPIQDVSGYSDGMQLITGMRPNTLIMGRQAWTKLKDHPEIIDRIKYSSSNNTPAIVTRQAIAALFEIDRLLVMDGIYATSPENPDFETNVTTAFIGGKNALLMYVPASPGIMMPSAGYTFSWTGYLAAGNMGQRVTRFRMEQLKSDRVEAEMAYDHKLTGGDLGVFFSSIVR